MFYGIFGDSNGDSPEVIGEASWRMGTACYPDGHISGANGHGQPDVTCECYFFLKISRITTLTERFLTDIVFSGKNAVLPSADMTKNYITQFSKLKSMGDQLVSSLSSNLKLSSSGSSNHTSSPSHSHSGSSPSKTSSSSHSSSSDHSNNVNVATHSKGSSSHSKDSKHHDSCS
jgi:chitosanase